MLLAGVTHHAGFRSFKAFCLGPCSGEAQYLRYVASCELPGVHGQQHGKIQLGTMLDELSVLFHTGLFLKRQN